LVLLHLVSLTWLILEQLAVLTTLPSVNIF